MVATSSLSTILALLLGGEAPKAYGQGTVQVIVFPLVTSLKRGS
jgi:hypothetical protein